MHDPAFVRRLERVDDLMRESQYVGRRHRKSLDALAKRLSLDQFEDECVSASVLL